TLASRHALRRRAARWRGIHRGGTDRRATRRPLPRRRRFYRSLRLVRRAGSLPPRRRFGRDASRNDRCQHATGVPRHRPGIRSAARPARGPAQLRATAVAGGSIMTSRALIAMTAMLITVTPCRPARAVETGVFTGAVHDENDTPVVGAMVTAMH